MTIMKYIIKGRPPQELRDFVNTSGASFNGCPCKNEWRKTLLEEQGYLCGYTMKRIENNSLTTKIAHIEARDGTISKDLNHDNVVACCLGNQGKPREEQYADTRQGDKTLKHITPLKLECEQLIKYRETGEIRCADENVRKEILDDDRIHPKHFSLLNLNHRNLVNGRLGAYDAVKRKLTNAVKGRDWRPRDIQDWISVYSTRDADGKFKEYCNFVVWRLNKEFAWRSRSKKSS